MELIPWLIAIYVIACVGAWYGHRWFMYFPDPARVAPAEAGLEGFREIEFQAGDGTALVAWYAPAKAGKPTLLYFHGNAANAANRAFKMDTMHAGGTGVFYLNNRGYGGSEGSPTEAANVTDAVAAYDHVRSLGIPASDIAAYGESLGAGQAIQLAAQRELRAVVIEAPLTSTVEVGRRTWFFLPLGLLMTDQWNNAEDVKQVDVPLLVLHGERDQVIPVEMGKRVHEAANEPKEIELFPEADHNDLFEHGAWERVKEFLDEPERR